MINYYQKLKKSNPSIKIKIELDKKPNIKIELIMNAYQGSNYNECKRPLNRIIGFSILQFYIVINYYI